MKPKHQRLIFVVVSMVFLCVGGMFTFNAFRENLIFFYSPSDLVDINQSSEKTIRIGGIVKAGSIDQGEGDNIKFIVTDGNVDIKVSYKGILPNLFREGQGCVAEGNLVAANEFVAKKILAKHDENYMPKEVVDALKRSGKWRGDGTK